MTLVDEAYAFSQARVTPVGTFRRTQRLPHNAQPRVTIGQMVKVADVLAAAEIPEQRRLIDLAKRLRIPSRDVQSYVLKQVGDFVSQGEVLARKSGFMGLGKRRVGSPIDGRIAWMDGGRVLIEGGVKRIEVPATMSGRVISLEPGGYVTIEGHGAAIEAVWGHGGLALGTLKVMDSLPSYTTETGRFTIDHRGSVIAIASPLNEQFIKEAAEIRVKGIVAASMNVDLLPVARNAPFPIAITQGFGQLPMSERILNLLSTHNGREIALAMLISDDSRESRPEIIIPIMSTQRPEDRVAETGHTLFHIGQRVRILQHPWMGDVGTIARIPEGLRQLPSGLWMAGAEIEVGPARTVFVPFANMQHLG